MVHNNRLGQTLTRKVIMKKQIDKNRLDWIIGSIAVLSFITLFIALIYPNSKISEKALLFLIMQIFALLALIVKGLLMGKTS